MSFAPVRPGLTPADLNKMNQRAHDASGYKSVLSPAEKTRYAALLKRYEGTGPELSGSEMKEFKALHRRVVG